MEFDLALKVSLMDISEIETLLGKLREEDEDCYETLERLIEEEA
jgi:hypothetical protein